MNNTQPIPKSKICAGIKSSIRQKWFFSIRKQALWHASTISLIKLAGTKSCGLCATECMVLGQHFANIHRHRHTKILKLKSEMHGKCSCKTRFLRFLRSNLRRGLWWGWENAQNQSSTLLSTKGYIYFGLKPVTRGCGVGAIPWGTTIWWGS